eukprot:TRINITY_DN32066_c0_g1_i1.p1 TRINITY_DN32066_c0_g1~~TRINITY_DN32066_c0_g1_i1.p1  ORF type:complete len:592 (-),score=75.43 TRINITY_DN32066_c0_g1_i1:163-1938(-)
MELMRGHSPLPRPDDSDDSEESASDEPTHVRGCARNRMERRMLWQWDRLVSFVLRRGSAGAGRILARHLVWAVAQWAVILLSTSAVYYWRAHEESLWALLMKNVFLFHYVLEFLGVTGMYSGLSPPFPLTWYRFRRGTLKEPFFAFFGDRRGVADLASAIANVAIPLVLLTVPLASPAMVLFFLCVLVSSLLDFSAFVGALGCYYGPISGIYACAALFGDAGHVAALQVLLLHVYISCGVAKAGPWFARVAMLECTQPAAFAGSPFWRNLCFENFEKQRWLPSRCLRLVAAAAAAVETCAPLLLLCTPCILERFGLGSLGTLFVDIGIALLCGMHAYIVLHFGSDVNMLNTVTAFWCVYVFRIASLGFDYAGFLQMNVALRGLLLLLFVVVVAGHLYPDSVCCQIAYRFWAGNWPQGFYLFSDAGLQKLAKAVPANVPPPRSVLGGWCASAHLWAGQLGARVLPALLCLASRERAQLTTVVPAFQVANFCLGSCSNCSLRALQLNPRLQRACSFDQGEAVFIFCGAFPLLGSKCWRGGCGRRMRWHALDLQAGQIAEGTFALEDVLAVGCPSDCGTKLPAVMPLLADAGCA